jgi:creatinine amidohydrolase/Fe(II)-dependent formamide hydrolase-like protein
MPLRNDGRPLRHHEWRKLRADELRDQAHRDAIVILPVASLEQHGPHLPVEVDAILGETVAARTAEKVMLKGQAGLALPVLWTGLSEHHISFGGTVTLISHLRSERGSVGPTRQGDDRHSRTP